MAINNFNVLDILWNPVSTVGPTMVGPMKVFKLEVLRRMENAILNSAFGNVLNNEI